MRSFDWNHDKNELLKRTRGVSFEDVVFHIENGDVLNIIRHPNASRYPLQQVIVVDIEGYAHLVPFVTEGDRWFLKTIIPSRKATKEYIR
ncbi:MAG: toxin [Gammaproteobacteria bacterium]|nr:toxin [Gammaproteobacteria bacterium]